MPPLITVIVPIYKVEAYLDRCIESIVNQEYTNLEIILVDDGSPDSCPAICDKWAERDERIKVIHKENGGVSSARNAALDLASGEYVVFLDSDDFIDSEMISVLIESAMANNAELASCLLRFCYDDGTQADENFYDDFGVAKGKNEILVRFLNEKFINPGVPTKIYLKRIIDEHSLRFDTSLKVAEDYLFNFYYLQHCQCVASLDNILYNYFIRKDSAFHSVSREVAERWRVTEYIMNDSSLDDEVMQSIKIKYAGELLSCAKEILIAQKSADADLNDCYFDIVEEIKKNYKDFSRLELSTAKKIKLLLMRASPKIFKFIYGLRYVIKHR